MPTYASTSTSSAWITAAGRIATSPMDKPSCSLPTRWKSSPGPSPNGASNSISASKTVMARPMPDNNTAAWSRALGVASTGCSASGGGGDDASNMQISSISTVSKYVLQTTTMTQAICLATKLPNAT